jgi:hypothetical protein
VDIERFRWTCRARCSMGLTLLGLVALGACGAGRAGSHEDLGGAPATGGAGGATGGVASGSGDSSGGVVSDSGGSSTKPEATGGAPADAGGSAGAGGAPASAGQGGATPGPAGTLDNPWGFPLRKPETRTIECSFAYSEDLAPQTLEDADQICTFAYGALSGALYLEATVVDCEYYYALVGSFSSRVWLSVGGQLLPVDHPEYSLGGDHFTDSLSFDHDGLHYVYYHASFNEYYRACQPMHCMRVYDGSAESYDTSSLIEDGCTTDRTLPVVCVAVAPDGSVPPLEDSFAPCPNDPNWPS